MGKINQCRLQELLHYDPTEGIFTWVNSPSNRVKIRDIAGAITPNGYITIGIDGKSYRCHRLAWLYITGEWPKYQIDHINRNKSDNKWNNLRECTQSQNSGNSNMHKDNKSGFKGVHWNESLKKWRVQIFVDSKNKHIGLFTNKLDAALAYNNAAIEIFGEFAGINELGGYLGKT